jgi:hypothetical protein
MLGEEDVAPGVVDQRIGDLEAGGAEIVVFAAQLVEERLHTGSHPLCV